VLVAEVQNFGDNELNIADGIQANGGRDNTSTVAPKPKNRVQIVTSNTKSEDKRPKSDATIRMRGNVLIQNPAQEWKVRSCELNGSFLTFFRKQKMVAAIDLEQVGDINVLRKINDSAGQGFIFALHLKEGRYFNVRVTMYDDALNWVKVLIETRDKLRSHHSHHSRTRSFSGHNETNYSSFTPLASDFNTSLLVADEPDDNIKVYFDNGQYPPSPIFESNEKYVRPLQSKSSADNVTSTQNSLGSPHSQHSQHSTSSSHRGSGVGPAGGDIIPTTPVLLPRALNDGQEGGFGRGGAEAEEVEGGDGADDETVKPYDSASYDDEEQRRAEAEKAMRAKLAEMEAERLAEEQAEEARLGAMIASARSARENAEKLAQAKAAREEKMREEQAARAAKIAADKAAEEEHLATERAAKEARFAAEKAIREKKAAVEKQAREKEATDKAEEEKAAADRALRVSEREAAAKKKLVEQAAAVKDAEKAEKQKAQESADRKANLRALQQAERKGSIIAAPSSPTRANPTTPSLLPSSPPKETPTPLSLAGSLFGQVDDMKFSQENMWRLSRSFDHAKPGYVQPELNLDGIDLTVVDSPVSSRSADSRKQLAGHIPLASPSLLKAATTSSAHHGGAAKTAELTVENVSQHTSSTASPPRVVTEGSTTPAKSSPPPSSFDEVYDSVPAGNVASRFHNTFSPRKNASTPERKRINSGATRPSSLLFQVCVGAVFIAVVVFGALGCATYYRRYQAQEMWRAVSAKNLPVNANARSASEISKSPSIGSSGAAAVKSTTTASMSTPDNTQPKTTSSTSSSKSPAGLTNKPALSSGASGKSPAGAENPHAVARNNNAIRKFFANLLRAPARLIASVFSKLASLFK